ncbi:MAG: cupin domain-containing protein [Desulfovibrio sp.]|jgi:predicted cupin superfamily sugar epimerase|nr:cupin domain-containing protein [Desulfovibrio sp.]
MQPHPEGGFFVSSYRSEAGIAVPGYNGTRPFSTAILYLLPKGDFSALHRLRQDEVWHFYRGTLQFYPRQGGSIKSKLFFGVSPVLARIKKAHDYLS